jgi:hypothetical protein
VLLAVWLVAHGVTGEEVVVQRELEARTMTVVVQGG